MSNFLWIIWIIKKEKEKSIVFAAPTAISHTRNVKQCFTQCCCQTETPSAAKGSKRRLSAILIISAQVVKCRCGWQQIKYSCSVICRKKHNPNSNGLFFSFKFERAVLSALLLLFFFFFIALLEQLTSSHSTSTHSALHFPAAASRRRFSHSDDIRRSSEPLCYSNAEWAGLLFNLFWWVSWWARQAW